MSIERSSVVLCDHMADERREDELPPGLRCTCRRGPTDSGMHDMGCLLLAQDPRTSDSNVGVARSSRVVTAFLNRGPDSGQIADEALDALEEGTPTLISVAGDALRLLMIKILRRRASQRGIELRCTTSKAWLAQKDSVSIDIVPQRLDLESAIVGRAIPDVLHREDAALGSSTRVIEAPDGSCVVSIFGQVNSIGGGGDRGTTSARFDAEGARAVRDRLDAYLARADSDRPEDSSVETIANLKALMRRTVGLDDRTYEVLADAITAEYRVEARS